MMNNFLQNLTVYLIIHKFPNKFVNLIVLAGYNARELLFKECSKSLRGIM